MKNLLLLVFLLNFYVQETYSQNIKVTYYATAVNGYLNYEPTLLITEKNSQYRVNYDDIIAEHNGASVKIDGQNYILNYEYATKEFTELRFLDEYEVSASWKNDQNWEILDDTKSILGYTVRKAKTKQQDHVMYAWFTNEIPVKSGPYQNAGLPGLILEFYFDESSVKCTAKNIEFNVNEDLKDFSGAFKITREELNNLKQNKKALKKRLVKAN